MDPNTCLRIATRIHFALLRHLGDSVEVQDILHRASHTREVLWVCDASGDDELIALAAQFRQASKPDVTANPASRSGLPASEPSTRGPSAADTGWDRESTGFGNSHLPEAPAADGRPEREWFRPSTWLRNR